MVLAYPWSEFTVASYVAAVSVAAAATLLAVPAGGPRAAGIAFLFAALATLDLVRLTIGTILDVLVFFFLAFGFVGAAWFYAFSSRSVLAWTSSVILVGSVGPAIYLVHDAFVGYTNQLLPDALLLVGFLMVWWGAPRAITGPWMGRPGFLAAQRSSSPKAR